MNAFSTANVAKAISRIQGTSTKDLRNLLERAKANRIAELIEAITAELAIRGSIDFDATAAQKHVAWARQAADRSLTETILMAFSEAPINRDELSLTRMIAQEPGISYQALATFRGKGDVSLILGHMVYERLGFFRRFLDGSERMSNLLFQRDDSSGRMTYRLTTEAEQAFRALQLI